MEENIEYSLEWLTNEIIKEDVKEKQTNKQTIISMKKMDLLKLVVKFIKLNRRKYE